MIGMGRRQLLALATAASGSIATAALLAAYGANASVLAPPAPPARARSTAVSVKQPVAPAAAPTGTASAPRLGRALGGVSLGTAETDVLHVLGEPTVRGAVHGQGGPEWTYANGLTVSLSSPGGAVFQVAARAPFAGASREGFRLGETAAQFQRRYAAFAIATPTIPPPQRFVRDGSGRTLGVLFGADGTATTLVLSDQTILCPDGCRPAVGSPGPDKGPLMPTATV